MPFVPVWAPACRRDLHSFELARGRNDEGLTAASATTMNENSEETRCPTERLERAVARKNNTDGERRGWLGGGVYRDEVPDGGKRRRI